MAAEAVAAAAAEAEAVVRDGLAVAGRRGHSRPLSNDGPEP
jgi:hypothetical protein